jgi:rfaE bifunctional protein kinase chain/domain
MSAIPSILSKIRDLQIGIVGDFVIDAYWLIDETHPETSLETGRPTHAVIEQKCSLGGAGNVANNLHDLGVARVVAFGVIGEDVFGREMLNLLSEKQIDTSRIVTQRQHWSTAVYAKPFIGLTEQDRIDFGRFNTLNADTADRLIAAIDAELPKLDGLIVNQQLQRGLHTDHFIAALQKLIDRHPKKIVLLDARHVGEKYTHVICKVNATEAARLCNEDKPIGQAIPIEDLQRYAEKIYQRTQRAVVITRGDRGILAYNGTDIAIVPGVHIVGAIDPCGAGDTTASAITAALSAGAALADAIAFGNHAASVIVRKLQQTGTACPAEILAAADDAEYLYHPEIAEDIRKARYLGDTDIEIVADGPHSGHIEHVIFDHDGTISTLREGWEAIMEPVMIRAILGQHYDDASEELYLRVVKRVRETIDQSTGIETIKQMDMLVRMVEQFNIVPANEIRDAAGYKAIYNDALMDTVNRRIDKLNRGELQAEHFAVVGAREFLHALRARGIKLYLASGTDHADVVREAEIQGYADCFEGRIYGWAGQGTGSAKKMVIEKILRENNLSGQSLACIGDGPVELRLAKQVGGLAIGIASDEVRRYGLNAAKRTRLIRAGADIVIPDYAQQNVLLKRIFGR